MTSDVAFAVALRRARMRLGVSQYDLARAIGCAQGSISRFECVTSSAHERTVKKYAAALGCRVELLLVPIEDDDGRPKQDEVRPPTQTKATGAEHSPARPDGG